MGVLLHRNAVILSIVFPCRTEKRVQISEIFLTRPRISEQKMHGVSFGKAGNEPHSVEDETLIVAFRFFSPADFLGCMKAKALGIWLGHIPRAIPVYSGYSGLPGLSGYSGYSGLSGLPGLFRLLCQCYLNALLHGIFKAGSIFSAGSGEVRGSAAAALDMA